MACSTNGLFDESERCPVPRVASESNGLLPPLHNAGVRHRTAGSDSSGRASAFAALMDSADAPTARAPASRAPANRAAQAKDRSQRPSEAPAPKNESKPDRSNSTNAADAADAARDPSQSKNEPEATDETKTNAADSPDEKATQDATASATDLLDLLTATVVDSGTTTQSMPTPPAAPVSVDAALTAQNAPASETSKVSGTPVAALEAPTAPAAQSAAPESTPAVDQAAANSQPATPEQSAPLSAAAADNPETTATTNGKAAVETGQQSATTNTSQDPAPAASGKTAAEQTASKPLSPSEQQPANAQPDAPIAQAGKRPTSKPDSTPADALKSDAATNVEDNGGRTTAPTEAKDPAAPADRHAPRRAHAEAPGVEDKQTAPLTAGGHDAGHKAPADSFHALLLANDQAAATTAAQTSAPTSDAMEPAVPIAGLAVEIAARAQAGQNRFEIRLDPPELGRIDVRLDIDSSGQVTSRLVVERADTLEHLRRDAAGLERALQDAGLKTGENGLQFSLRDQGFAGRDDNSQSPATARMLVPDPDLAPVDLAANTYGRMMRTGGVDIRI
jgi:flagellar hook-length control protein FliK